MKRTTYFPVTTLFLFLGALVVGCEVSAPADDDDDDGSGGTPSGSSGTSGTGGGGHPLAPYAHAYCEQRVACACPQVDGLSVEACTNQLLALSPGANADFDVDADCVAYRVAQLDRTACAGADPDGYGCMDQCQMMVGRAQLGAPCSLSGGVDQICAAGLRCDFLADAPTCLPLCPNLSAGQACSNPFDCGPGLACTSAEICEPESGEGQPCGIGDCASGLHCTHETCVRTPGIGEPCPDNFCGPGAECTTDGVCVAGSPMICF